MVTKNLEKEDFESIFEWSDQPVFIISQHGRHIYQNSSASQVFAEQVDGGYVFWNPAEELGVNAENIISLSEIIRDIAGSNSDKHYDLEITDRHEQLLHIRLTYTHKTSEHLGHYFFTINELNSRAKILHNQQMERAILALQAGDYGVWDWDFVNDKIIWDDGMYAMYGFQKDAAHEVYEVWSQRVDPEDKQMTEERLQEALAGGRKFEVIFRIITDDGVKKYIKSWANVYFNDNGEPLRMIGINKDITLEQQLQHKLALNERKLREFFEMAPVGIALTDTNGTFVEINPEFQRHTGYTKEELNALTYWDLTPKKYEADEQKQLELIHQEGKYGPYEKEYIHKNGHHYPVILNGAVVYNESERKDYIWSVIQDITPLRNAQKSLLQFRQFFEMTEDLLVILNLNGIPEKPNPKFLSVTGHDIKIILKQPITHWVHPEDLDAVTSALQDVVEKNVPVEFRGRFRNSKGTYRWLLCSLIRDKEKVYFAARDITKILKTKQALIKSNEELNSFAYVASHDLKEPIRVISNYLRLLQRKYGDTLDEKAQNYINRTIKASLRMYTLINDLLEYSRVDHQELEPSEVNTQQMVEKLLEDMEVRITQENATIEVGQLPPVLGDFQQVYSVFQNLLSNALKYHAPESPVHITISAVERNRRVEFAVADNGIGIDKKYAERIFQIFKRLHVRDQYEGTGIGLSIAKKIVERHSGKIWFDSTPGHGTTFYFTFLNIQ